LGLADGQALAPNKPAAVLLASHPDSEVPLRNVALPLQDWGLVHIPLQPFEKNRVLSG